MSDLPPPSMPAGWYPDPKTEGTERLWDGQAWTEHVRFATSASTPPAVPNRPAPSMAKPAALPPKKRIGCFGIGVLVVTLIVVVAVMIGMILANTGGSSGGGGTTDPIEQARVVLSTNFGESYSYSEVKSATDAALSATGESVNDDMRNRGWSSILTVVKAPELSAVSPMEVMRCVAREGVTPARAGLGFPDVVALCAVAYK
ncbi:MAG: hypothetical protein JWP75_3429 [Frondihabitans sp.]|nr:hypothetical protein [Frondihabitans sp.]